MEQVHKRIVLALKCRILRVEICNLLWKQKNEENTTHVFYKINYINSHIKFPHIRWVITHRNAFQEVALNLILLLCQLTSFNWQRSMIKLKGTSQRCIPSSQKRMHSKRLLWIESYCPANEQISIDRGARSNSKEPLRGAFPSVTLIIYKGIRCENYIVDYVEYMLCSLNLLTFQWDLQITTFSIRHFNIYIFSKQTRIKLKFQQNKDSK